MESDPPELEVQCHSCDHAGRSAGFVAQHRGVNGKDADEIELGPEAAIEVFRTAIGGRPQRVKDKSRLRYVMYRSGAVRDITRLALKLMPAHPEHIDSFAAYLQNSSKSAVVMRAIIAQLQAGVLYDYVQGELWLIASRLGETIDLQELLPLARARSRGNGLSFSMQRGLTAFFLSCARADVYPQGHAMKRFGSKSPFIQSLLIPYLADSEYSPNGAVPELLASTAPAPAMVLAAELVGRNLSLAQLGAQRGRLAPEARNVFQGLGLIEGGPRQRFDQIGDLLRRSFDVPLSRRWRNLLSGNY